MKGYLVLQRHEKLVPFLGRHVSYTETSDYYPANKGQILSGCFVCVFHGHSLWVAIDAGSDAKGNICSINSNLTPHEKISYVGPRHLNALFSDTFEDFTVHEPIKNFSPRKWWLLGIPQLIGVLRK